MCPEKESWIRFQESAMRNPKKKTKEWAVLAVNERLPLGYVKWFSNWRKYCFFPLQSTIYEQDCLRDIANFCESQTKTHREGWKNG